jgi:hypothetical protein
LKNKFTKILGVAVTLGIALALVAGFALPAAASPAETLNEWYKFDYPDAGEDGDWFRQGDEPITRIGEITEAINGDLYVHVVVPIEDTDLGYDVCDHIFKSEDGGRTWENTGYDEVEVCSGDIPRPGWVYDMVCSSIDEDVVYATDGFYVYKTDDGGDEWDLLACDSLEEQLGGACLCCLTDCIESYVGPNVITSIDVAYDEDDNPYVFIGTRAHYVTCGAPCVSNGHPEYPGDVLYIGEAGYPANWTSLNLCCWGPSDPPSTPCSYSALAVGCAPDWADSKETYVVVTSPHDERTFVVYTKGTVCGWYEFAELEWDCLHSFGSLFASRIGFPDDWEDTETLFVGVVGEDVDCPYPSDGGDVYLATDDGCIDLNVAGIETGCIGEEPVDIISLDVCGDTDDAALIAGAFCDTSVYYSTDGGWSWDESEKDPTGEWLTYVLWYGDCAEGALAATSGCECAFSMSCGEEVGEFWNQISLIATNIDEVRYLGFSPGYVCEDSETMFMVTWSWGYEQEECYCYEWCDETSSLFRHDGTYWERVYLGSPDCEEAEHIDWVFVSPDFNTTNCVYVANKDFGMWRSTDAGCSWDLVSFPCAPRDCISAVVVIDEDIVIAGGADGSYYDCCDPARGYVFKTTRHGARPWKDYEVDGVGDIISFDLEPGYEDPGTVLLGDNMSQVYISEDGGEEWDLVGDCATVLGGTNPTWVAFDPGYATNNIIYAAAGEVIARCTIDWDEDWVDQEWEELCDQLGEAWGIKAAGDTALYVTDVAQVEEVTIDDVDYYIAGGVLRSLNPDAEDEDDVVFERVAEGLIVDETELHDLWLTCDTSDEGCAENVLWSLDWYDLENVWVYEDTLAAPVVLDLPVDGQKLTTTDEATLSWKELCGADCYEVDLYRYCAECPDEKLTVDLCLECEPYDDVACGPPIECDWFECCPCTEEICIVVDDLEPGTTYYWQVRVCQGQPTLSKWSEERTFTTALLAVPFADLCSPDCGAQDIILTPSFSWGEVDGATGYDVELATTETFTVGVIKGKTTVNAWKPGVTLEYATTYYWRVRAFKDGVYSGWTYCLFTTMEEPVEPPPPVEVVVPPPPPAPVINIPPAQMITPTWIYAIIGVGAALAIVVIVLIVRTRRPPA